MRIDSLTAEGRRSLYTPDFLIRKTDGKYVLAETKGRVDRDVPGKARAAIEWCKAASAGGTSWEYLFVPQSVFMEFSGEGVGELLRSCQPSLRSLLREADSAQMALPLQLETDETSGGRLAQFVSREDLEKLTLRARRGVEHAVLLFDFMASKQNVSFAPVFQPLLGPIDEAAETLVLSRLGSAVPEDPAMRSGFFEVAARPNKRPNPYLAERGRSLKRLLVDHSPIMPTGLLLFCLEYQIKTEERAGNIFSVVERNFRDLRDSELPVVLRSVYNFRNTYIAHEKDTPLNSQQIAEEALHQWVNVLVFLQRLLPRR